MKLFRRTRKRSRRRNRPILRFSPYAWAKLLFLRDQGPTEVGGFGISADADPLLVENLKLVKQSSTSVSVRFDDAAVADHFDDCVDTGLPPERFARIWIHTHPGESATPSGTDERTFARVFGGCDWAVMAIVARGGASYARLRFSAGPGGELEIRVKVDYTAGFAAADPAGWMEEYARCIVDESAERLHHVDVSRFAAARDLAAARLDAADELWPPVVDPSDFPVSESRIWEFHDEHQLDAAPRPE